MSVRSCWLMVLFSSSTFLLLFCLVVLSVAERGVSKYSTIIVDLSTSPFSYIRFCFIYYAVPLFDVQTFKIAMFSWLIDAFSIM